MRKYLTRLKINIAPIFTSGRWKLAALNCPENLFELVVQPVVKLCNAKTKKFGYIFDYPTTQPPINPWTITYSKNDKNEFM